MNNRSEVVDANLKYALWTFKEPQESERIMEFLFFYINSIVDKLHTMPIHN